MTERGPREGPEPHRNDIYAELDDPPTETPAIAAATVVLLRDAAAGAEVLMLHKSSKIAFGGMWVFPGGRIDEEDYPPDRDPQTAARTAAAREAREEADLRARPEEFVWISHWTPPPSTPRRRYATWFFATRAEEQPVRIDGGEIQDHDWLRPDSALENHAAGKIDLAPPTWVTLYHLSRYGSADAILDHFRNRRPTVYETHIAQRRDGVRVALWHGDAGYDEWNADAPGERHRLTLERAGFTFEHPQDWY